MNSSPSTSDRSPAALAASLARWRTLALSLTALICGITIGGMGARTIAESGAGSPVVGVTTYKDAIYRVHENGSVTYIKVDDYVKTAKGVLGWGPFNIDPARRAPALPLRHP